MPLKQVEWTCPCGTTLRYWNTLRQEVHEQSQKHLRWKNSAVVIEKKYKQRWREDGFCISPDQLFKTDCCASSH